MQTITAAEVVTQEVIDEFWERGYWRSPKLFSDEQIETMRNAHDRLWNQEYDSEVPSQYRTSIYEEGSLQVRQQCNSFWLNKDIKEVVTSEILGEIAGKLLKVDEIRLWHDQCVYKPGLGTKETTEKSGNIGWHQDYAYWQCSNNPNMITAWIALQDTTLENGGMRTIVGSHKWGLREDSNTFFEQDLEALAKEYAKTGKGEWLDEPCDLKAGEVSFHHALTYHGSGPNFSDNPRLCLISHLMPGWHNFS